MYEIEVLSIDLYHDVYSDSMIIVVSHVDGQGIMITSDVVGGINCTNSPFHL
jgi:hypothetical protein